MSQSSSRRSSKRLVAMVVLVGGLGLQPGLALAEDTAPVVPIDAPVVAIVAPVLDIEFSQSDLLRMTRVEQSPARTRITLDSTVLFAKDSAKINTKARGRIRDAGRRLLDRGPGRVRITGYTDDLGSAAYGKSLSKRRAAAVATLLRAELPARDYPFTIVGRGEDDPAVPNTSEKNRKVNRRVVLVYQKS